MGDLVTFCMPDFSKCGAAAGDVVPNLMEAVEYFTSMRWMNFEETGTKAYVQDPSCIFWHNLPLCLGMVCLPGCGCATLSRTLTKMTDTTCESNCLSCCALSCICSTNVCWYAKKHADFRKKYDIKGSDGMDCAQACCCFHCLLCQDANQVMTEDKEFKIPMAEL